MALMLKEKPVLIQGSNAMEEIKVPEMDATLLMPLLEESDSEECCNVEEVNSLMESLETEIRMASHGSGIIEGRETESNDGFDCFESSKMEMVPFSTGDCVDWHVEDHVEEIWMDDYLVQFGNDFPLNC